MSGNHSQRPRQSADDFVRSILDDRPTAEVSPSGELLRVIERFHGTLDRGAGRTTSDRPLSTSNDSLGSPPFASVSSRNLQRRFSREPSSIRDVSPIHAAANGAAHSSSLPPLRGHLSRRGSSMSSAGAAGGTGNNPSGARWVRYRPSERYRAANNGHAPLADLDLRVGSPTSHIRALLDMHNGGHSANPPPSPPLMAPPVHSQDLAEDSRRAKRRKLDPSDRLAPAFKGFRYGRYGQVEPGRLTMEIVSCDGGIYGENPGPGIYAAENILKNDNSVYCTRGSRCNIVLRHQGATVFSLKELVIKAPGSNYSQPVREGMVFVSMNKDELLTRTAQYQIQYGRARHFGRETERDSRTPVFSVRHGEDGSSITRITHRRRVYNILDDPVDTTYMTAQVPPEFMVPPAPFKVTTECSDDEGDGGVGGGEASNARYGRRRTPNRIGSLPFESDSSDDWGQVEDGAFGDMSEYIRAGHPSSGGGGGGDMSLEEAVEASQLATQEAVRAVGGALMAPHARFFIEKDKSKCTIRFDPPVSGRFILLKMWNPHLDPVGDINIDIQGVVAKGFAGPRFFPAVELR